MTFVGNEKHKISLLYSINKCNQLQKTCYVFLCRYSWIIGIDAYWKERLLCEAKNNFAIKSFAYSLRWNCGCLLLIIDKVKAVKFTSSKYDSNTLLERHMKPNGPPEEEHIINACSVYAGKHPHRLYTFCQWTLLLTWINFNPSMDT